MSERDLSWWTALIENIVLHRLGWFTGFSAFIAAVYSGLRDGKGWAHSSFGGVMCVIIALGFVAALHAGGMYQTWLPLVGVFVGFVGAERIRDAVLGAWDARKGRMIAGGSDERQR